MILRTDTPIHYFIKDESDSNFYEMELEAYLELPQNGYSKFRNIEDMRLFISTDMERNNVSDFQIDHGHTTSCYSGYDSLKELIEGKTKDRGMITGFTVATQEQYLALRQKAFDIYLKYPHVDFNRLKIGDEI